MNFKLEDLFKQIRENTKLIVLNFPHNPTGATITEIDLNKIIQLAQQKNIVVFSDEMYRFLEYDQQNSLPSVSEIYDEINGKIIFSAENSLWASDGTENGTDFTI